MTIKTTSNTGSADIFYILILSVPTSFLLILTEELADRAVTAINHLITHVS